MKIRILRGTNQIGGSSVIIATENVIPFYICVAHDRIIQIEVW